MAEVKRLTREKPTVASLDLGDGDTVNMTFDANKVTPRWMNQTMESMSDTDMLGLAKALEEALISWDVTDDGAAWPPTSANIANLSFPVVNQLFEAVCVAAAPSSAEGNGSPPSANEPRSASEPTSASFPNGSDGSTSPKPSDALSTS